jgi:uncharacterized protein
MDDKEKAINHLRGETSPYLLQHLYNPVDWYPWGEEALEKAAREDKPILISVGYSACHWCHVMEKESFEDEKVAEIMNNNFVCIKVDREERPDVDHMYMTAVQLLGGRGGWPLNCFALPDSRPFWGATYFPREQWIDVLVQVSGLYQTRRDDLVTQAENLTEGVNESGFIQPGDNDNDFQTADADAVFQNIMKHMDTEEGGTLGAPKFPLPVNLEFLLHYHHHCGNEAALQQVEVSLEKMAMGGIYDQIGGGFARYSTDDLWKVPHFEKMLYDNGQLVSVYSNAWKITGNHLFRDVVYRTVEFVDRELTSPEGTFYSALDADSEGEEGKFYVWREEEIDSIIPGSDLPIVREYYQIGKKGLWEDDKNILIRGEKDDEFCRRMNISAEEFHEIINRARKLMLKARSERVRPGLDNKVLASWNALMIKGLADAYSAFGEKTFLSGAEKAAGFFTGNHMTPEGKIFRSLRGESRPIDGFLEDYALFIMSLIRLWEVSMNTDWLKKANVLAEYVMENFTSPGTRLFSFSSSYGESLKSDHFDVYDNVIPASNSVMAINLLYLANYFERTDWSRRSFQILSDVGPRLLKHGINFANWGRLLLYNVHPLYTLAICGPEAGLKIKEINPMYIPDVIIAGSSREKREIPVFRDRFKSGQTWFYVCSMGSCKMPVDKLESALEQVRQES